MIKEDTILFKVRFLGESSLSFINDCSYSVIGKTEFDLWYIIDESGEAYCYSLEKFELI